MSSPDPSSTTPGHRENGANGTNGHAGVPSVVVGAGVEKALADVQRQLARQATTLRGSTPAALAGATPITLVTAPVAPVEPRPAKAPKPPKPPRQRRATPPPPPPPVVVPAPAPSAPAELDDLTYVDDDDLLYEHEVTAGNDVVADAPVRQVRPVARAPIERRIDVDELTRAERAALGGLQARKVRRIVRDVSPWSVFKFSVLFFVCVWLIVMVAGVILWKVGQDAGVIANVEKFYAKAAGEKSFELDGRQVFRAGAASGAILVAAATGLSVLIAVLFNLITDLTGGIRMSVVELESARRPLRRRPTAATLKRRSLDVGPDDGPADVDEGAAAVAPAPGAGPVDADAATTATGAPERAHVVDRDPTGRPPAGVPRLVPDSDPRDEADSGVPSATR